MTQEVKALRREVVDLTKQLYNSNDLSSEEVLELKKNLHNKQAQVQKLMNIVPYNGIQEFLAVIVNGTLRELFQKNQKTIS